MGTGRAWGERTEEEDIEMIRTTIEQSGGQRDEEDA